MFSSYNQCITGKVRAWGYNEAQLYIVNVGCAWKQKYFSSLRENYANRYGNISLSCYFCKIG